MSTNVKPCRNCGGTERYTESVGARGGYGPNLLPIGFTWCSPQLQIEVCGICGLMDWFVPPEHRDAVKKKFRRLE